MVVTPGDGSFLAYHSRLAVVEAKSYDLVKPQVPDVYAGIAGGMVDDAHYPSRARLEGKTDERAPPGAARGDRLVRLVGWFVALVLVMAIALAFFAPAAHWLARRDVGTAREPLLQAARVTEQKRPLEVGAGLFAAGALLALSQDSIMARRMRKRQRAAQRNVAQSPAPGVPPPGQRLIVVPLPDADPDPVAPKVADPAGGVTERASAVAARVTGAAEETTAEVTSAALVAGPAAARATDEVPEPEHAATQVAAESEPAADVRAPEPGPVGAGAPEPEPVAAGVGAAVAAEVTKPVAVEPAKVAGVARVTDAVAAEVPQLEPVAAPGSPAEAAVGVPLRDSGAAEHYKRRGLLAAGARLALAPGSIMAQRIRKGQRALADPVGAEAPEPHYSATIEKLGSPELQVRVDCIYVLERVALDSAADHPAVIEVLTAFIGAHSDELWPPGDSGDLEQEQSVRPDVQAALTVIGRRKNECDIRLINLMGARLVRAYLTWANLSGTDLRYADLGDANLHGAYLTRADLSGARLVRADLTRANLSGATLEGALLTRAHLSGANLSWANLTDADLTAADLHGADLTGAKLHGAYLTAANLTGANLTRADLTRAVLLRACVTSVDISGAKLTDARWSQQAVGQVGWQYE